MEDTEIKRDEQEDKKFDQEEKAIADKRFIKEKTRQLQEEAKQKFRNLMVNNHLLLIFLSHSMYVSSTALKSLYAQQEEEIGPRTTSQMLLIGSHGRCDAGETRDRECVCLCSISILC